MIDHAAITLLSLVALMFLISIVATHIALTRDGWTAQKYQL